MRIEPEEIEILFRVARLNPRKHKVKDLERVIGLYRLLVEGEGMPEKDRANIRAEIALIQRDD